MLVARGYSVHVCVLPRSADPDMQFIFNAVGGSVITQQCKHTSLFLCPTLYNKSISVIQQFCPVCGPTLPDTVRPCVETTL